MHILDQDLEYIILILHKMKVGICTKVKDEQHIIREWVRHYLRLGFDRIIIYDDNSYPPVKKTLRDNDNDAVIIIDTPTTNQAEAYKDGLSRCEDLDWVLLCDADEFIWTDGRDLKLYLTSAPEQVGTILLNWLTYGTSGIIKMRSDISIFQQFISREPYISYLNGYVKSFVRPKMADIHIWVHISYSPHRLVACADGTIIRNIKALSRSERVAPISLGKMPILLVHYMTLDYETMARKSVRNKSLTDIGDKYTLEWYERTFTDSVIDRRMMVYDI